MTRPGPAASRVALELAEQRRRARRDASARDHFDRTRHSLVLGGVEIGYVKPTAETEAKLRPDPIVRLVANETLTREQGRAAVEIRTIYERLSAGLLARTSDPANRSPGTRPNLPERIALLHSQRYLPWARLLGGAAAEPSRAAPAQQGRCPEALEVAIAVIIDGATLAQCDRARHWRNGTSAQLLVYALALYTDLAGWERNRDMLAAFEATRAKRARR
ncbi:MAG TPA: hypothetical protein VE397_04910 [Stellaceae bacterium]|jgi:hypothetical protein|nr:hypothetical protein [Stellaceae bacterium]